MSKKKTLIIINKNIGTLEFAVDLCFVELNILCGEKIANVNKNHEGFGDFSEFVYCFVQYSVCKKKTSIKCH